MSTAEWSTLSLVRTTPTMIYLNLALVLCLATFLADAAPTKQEGVEKPPVPPQAPHLVYGLAPGEVYSDRDQRGQYAHGFSAPQAAGLAGGPAEFAEKGTLISTNGGWEYVIAKEGAYSYTSPEGQRITVRYIADHNGFRILPNDAPFTL